MKTIIDTMVNLALQPIKFALRVVMFFVSPLAEVTDSVHDAGTKTVDAAKSGAGAVVTVGAAVAGVAVALLALPSIYIRRTDEALKG